MSPPLPKPLWWLCLAGAIAVVLGGCGREVEADLIRLQGVSPARVQPGHRLVISGAELPAGRAADIRLEGVLHRPGRAPRPIDWTGRGTVPTRERVELPLPASTFRALGEWGTFRGTVQVGFGSDTLGGRVVGRLEGVVLDLVPSSLPAPARGPSFATQLGLELGPADDGEGLLVTRVVPGGRAEAAGIEEGWVLLELDGLRLLATDAFSPPPDVGLVTLTVMRPNGGGPASLRLSLEGLEDAIPRRPLLLVQLAVLGWLFAALFFGPTGAWIDRLTLPRVRRAAWPHAVGAGALAVVVRCALGAFPSVGLDGVLLAVVGGRVAVGVLHADRSTRLGAWVRGGAALVAALGALGAATLALGTTAPAALEAAQGPLPWAWIALRSPGGALAAVGFGLTAACGPRLVEGSPRTRALDDLFLGALAALAVIAVGGGASATRGIEDVRPALAPVGFVPFAVLAALVTLVFRRARDRGALARAWWLFGASVALAALAVGAAVGWSELRVPADIERAIGEGLLALSAMLTWRIMTAHPPAPARPLHAML